MNKKILIGSIIAVAILIGVSFTSVVGYRSGASDVKESPLFNIRTSRAIDEESEDVSFEYVGKGDEINLLIPNRNDNGELIQKIINMISKIDDKTFDKFIDKIINFIPNNKMINNMNIFKNIHNKKLIDYFMIMNYNNNSQSKDQFFNNILMDDTYYFCHTSETNGCYLELLLLLIFIILVSPILIADVIAGFFVMILILCVMGLTFILEKITLNINIC